MTKYEMVNVIVRLNGFRHYLTAGNPIWDTDEVEKIFDTAVEAIEKQMPKPYTTDIDTSWGVRQKMPLCPECDHFIGYHRFIHGDNRKVTYCEHCGQAIDWKGGE